MKSFFSPVSRFIGFYGIFLATVAAYATDIVVPNPPAVPDRIHVGDEPFWRAEGAKLVRQITIGAYGTEKPGADESSFGNGFEGWRQVGSPWSYPTGETRTEAELLQIGKGSLADYIAGFNSPNALYGVSVAWAFYVGNTGAGVPFSHITFFRLERDTRGKLRPPAWVVENLQMDTGRNVYMRAPGVVNGRLRWWDGEGFKDSNPAYRVGLQSATRSFLPDDTVAVDPETGIIGVLAKPILERAIGVLTIAFADRAIVRYKTTDGAQLLGKQENKEPTFIVAPFPPEGDYVYVGISADESVTPSLERTSDFFHWEKVETLKSDGGGLFHFRRKNSVEFYRAITR
ncbi:MAG: hypothetical protein HYW65_00120 [Candidatus Liptonbacteria bacterium]|nr:hypothetical protein [Candidatus Liptonbacteria bacterium]